MTQDTIHIQLMNHFRIMINGTESDVLINKSRKGVRLIEYLILNFGKTVSNQRILSALWSEDSANPENALKTLISRLRVLMNQISPGLGSCIISERGAYSFLCLPHMTIDLYRVEEIFSRLNNAETSKEESCALYDELLRVYCGDLMCDEEVDEWSMARAVDLHDKYMSAVYSYIEILKADERWEDVVSVCRTGLAIDQYDDRLHMELMTALIKTNRTADALTQYHHAVSLNYRHLGIQPSRDMQDFYKNIVRAGKTLEFNIDAVGKELRERENQKGAFVCEYSVFKEIYNLQIRNLDRLGTSMFLGIIMVGKPEEATDSLKQNNLISSLIEIARSNLRKGDTIAQISPTMIALLMPTVNYTTGNMVMERIKKLFQAKHHKPMIPFHYRIAPLSGADMDETFGAATGETKKKLDDQP